MVVIRRSLNFTSRAAVPQSSSTSHCASPATRCRPEGLPPFDSSYGRVLNHSNGIAIADDCHCLSGSLRFAHHRQRDPRHPVLWTKSRRPSRNHECGRVSCWDTRRACPRCPRRAKEQRDVTHLTDQKGRPSSCSAVGPGRWPRQVASAARQLRSCTGYERFKRNNIGIRYWNRYYRGCWHRICPPVDTRALM